VRLHGDLKVTDRGQLFLPPVDPEQSLPWVIEHERLPLSLADLERRVFETFSGFAPLPGRDHLPVLLARLDFTVQADQVVGGRTGSIEVRPAPSDDLPVHVGRDRTWEETVRDMLIDAAESRGFRLIVSPPESHAEIGRSVAAALDARYLSFEDLWFTAHRDEVPRMERAERFSAQRPLLTRSAEDLVQDLLGTYGRPGERLVLGDTALWGLFQSLDLVRRLYDETLSGEHGFWVLVVPGVIHERQPLFNERDAMWHLEGVTLPLPKPLPARRGDEWTR
jgi:hypothetical protein